MLVTVKDSGPGLTRTPSTRSLTRSTRRSPAAWAWDFRLAVPFFRRMEAGCGLRPRTARAQSSIAAFRSTMQEQADERVAGV